MKKKIIGMWTALLVGSMLFTGCGASQQPGAEKSVEEEMVFEEVKEEPVTGLLFDVPENFILDEEVAGLYLSEEYTEDYACIFYQEAAADAKYSLLTEENIEELMQEIYAKTYGMDTIVDVVDFHRFNLDGYEAYYTECEYSVNDVPLQTIEYAVIAGEQAFSVTYVQKQGAGWKAAFAQSAENLKVRQ